MKKTAYLFAKDVDHQIEALSSAEYHQRSGRSKRLREELCPISRLALQLKQPGVEVEVEAFENNGADDGRLWVTGFWEGTFDVQVTIADYSHEEYLRNEMLALEGYAPGAGEIFRDKKTKKINATMAGVDIDEYFNRIANSVMARFQNKASLAYGPKTFLIIVFDEKKLSCLVNWSLLFDILKEKGGLSSSNFYAVYLFNCATNEIQKFTELEVFGG